MAEHRAERISEALREELSELIGYETADPRLELVSVLDVQVSPDLRVARVLVAVAGETQDRSSAMRALTGAKAYFRRQLAARLELHHLPDLQFEMEEAFTSREKVRGLLRRMRRGRPKSGEGAGNPHE